MISKTHITILVALVFLSWFVILAIFGQAPFSLSYFKPFGTVVTVIGISLAVFDKFLWSKLWNIHFLRGWLVNVPDIQGTWRAVIISNFENANTNESNNQIDCYISIKQTFTSLSLRLMSAESISRSVAYKFTDTEKDVFNLAVLYRNEPNIELQGVISNPHYGSLWLEISGKETTNFKGHYWTDRNTRGSIKCFGRIDHICHTYEEADNNFASTEHVL